MQHLFDGDVHYIISGAGSQVRELTNQFELSARVGLFGIGRQGFAVCDIVEDRLHLQFVDYFGMVLYATNITRRVVRA